MRRLATLLLAAALVALAAAPCAAEIGRNVRLDVDPTWVRVEWSFEFAAGGQLQLNATLLDSPAAREANNSLKLLVSTREQVRVLAEKEKAEWCQASEDANWPPEHVWLTVLGESALPDDSLTYVAPERQWLYLLVLNCHEDEYKVRLDYVAVNPGGEYLSLSEVPYKTLYVWLPVSWALLAGVWVAAWWPYRSFNVSLARLMTAVPVAQAAAGVALLFYWRARSETGLEPPRVGPASQAFVGAARGAFWLCLLYMASGWGVSRRSLGVDEARRVQGTVAFLVASYWIFQAFGGFFLFCIIVAYVWVLRYAAATVMINSVLLGHQVSLLRSRGCPAERSPAHAKYHMFVRLRSCVVTYVASDVVFHLWAAVFLHDEPWMEDAVEHLLTAALAVALVRVFRPRPFCPYYYVPTTTDADAERQERFRAAHTWRPGMPMPPVDLGAPFAPPRSLPVVVVRGPAGSAGASAGAAPALGVAKAAFPTGGRGAAWRGPAFLRPGGPEKEEDERERRRRDRRARRVSHRRLSSMSRPAGDRYEELGEAEEEDNAYAGFDDDETDDESGAGAGAGVAAAGGRRRGLLARVFGGGARGSYRRTVASDDDNNDSDDDEDDRVDRGARLADRRESDGVELTEVLVRNDDPRE